MFNSVGTMQPNTFFVALADTPSAANPEWGKHGPSSALTSPSQVSLTSSERPAATYMNGVGSLLQLKGIEGNDPQVVNAQCQQGQTLTHLVRNHCAMVLLLKQLGFTVPLPKKGGKIDIYGLTFQASEVLDHFSWAATLLDHKCGWYDWAEVVARSQWKGLIPG
jgi:hypothetical protein